MATQSAVSVDDYIRCCDTPSSGVVVVPFGLDGRITIRPSFNVNTTTFTKNLGITMPIHLEDDHEMMRVPSHFARLAIFQRFLPSS